MRSLTFFGCFFVLISCNNQTTNKNSTEKDSVTIYPKISADTEKIIQKDLGNTGLYIWSIDFYHKTKSKNSNFRKEYLSIDTLIKGLNQLYPEIKLQKVKLSGDTLFTRIKDSEFLGERMGTDGAAIYLATTIINLTTLKMVKHVKIDFNEGSHASPGVWSADDFKDYKEAK